MAESLMLGTYNDQQEIEDWSERIIHEADRLKRRVDAILRRTHEATAPEPKPVDLHSEVNKALAVSQERYNAKRTRLRRTWLKSLCSWGSRARCETWWALSSTTH